MKMPVSGPSRKMIGVPKEDTKAQDDTKPGLWGTDPIQRVRSGLAVGDRADHSVQGDTMRTVDEAAIGESGSIYLLDERLPPGAPGLHRRRTLASALVLCCALTTILAAGCSPSASGVSLDRGVGRPVPWDSIGETAACEAMNPQYCRGAFGFVIDPGGGWRAGPTPTHSVRSGALQQEELTALSNALHALLATLPPTCTAISGRAPGAPVIPGVRTVVTLVLSDGRRIDLGGPTDLLPHPCVATPESDALRVAFQTLLAKYYPLPFTS
jgi:hypothetical protein